MRLALTLAGDVSAQPVIRAQHLGANFLFNRVAYGESIGEGAYDELARLLNVGHLRYPGGTMTERQFSLADPDNQFQSMDLVTGAELEIQTQHWLTPLSEFLDFADEIGAQVSIVLPTAQYAQRILTGDDQAVEREVKGFIRDLMSGPHGNRIEMLEIGNEWATWFENASDYGRVADRMIVWTAEALNATGTETAIAIQASARAARQDESADIATSLSAIALDAIDAVITHNYRPVPWENTNITQGKLAHAEVFEALAGRPLDRVVTEWNVANGSHLDGMGQAAGILDLLYRQVAAGADMTHIWPLLEGNSSALGWTGGLYAGGEIVRQLQQSVVGLRPLPIEPAWDVDADGMPDLLTHAFGTPYGGRLVVFVSALSADGWSGRLDLTGLERPAAGHDALWITQMEPLDGVDPLSPRLIPTIEQSAHDPVATIDLALGGYEIVRLEYVLDRTVTTVGSVDGRELLRATDAADVFRVADDGNADVLRDFDPGIDRLDLSTLAPGGADEIMFRNLERRDGSVAWIEVIDSDDEVELLLRFADGPTDAALLGADSLIFAEGAVPVDPEMIVEVEDTGAEERLRGSQMREIFVMSEDGEKDLLDRFDLATDMIDVSAFGLSGFESLELENLVRRDGSVAWIAVSAFGEAAEFLLRFDDADATDAALLSDNHFIF